MEELVKSSRAHYVVSDLHLMDRSEEFLFNFEKQEEFCKLSETILKERAKLILNGDIFDFTGMTPCRNGLNDFFDQVVPFQKQNPELINKVSKFRSTRELLEDIQRVFPKFFGALSKLAAENSLVYIPGNHDCDFINPILQKDLTEVLEVAADNIEWTRQYRVGRNLIVAHGNQFDPANVTDKSCQNPGLVFTSALYTAVLPALQMLGVDREVIAAIPAVRPEENVIKGLRHFLSEAQLQNILLALTKLLARNHYFTGVKAIPGWFLTRNVPVISGILRQKVTTDRVLNLLPKDEKLMADARAGANKLFRQLKRKNRISDNGIIVLGHTHEIDRTNNYINLGTWIDHIRGLDKEEISAPETSLPVLRWSATNEFDFIDFKTGTLKN